MVTDYFFVVSAVLFLTGYRALMRIFNRGGGYGGIFFYGFVMSVFASSVFAVYLIADFQFNTATLIYSGIYALSYSFALFSSYYAVKTGPLALSGLVQSFALIVPTLYGFIFLGDSGNTFIYIGFAAVTLSIFLINFNFKKGAAENNKISLKWMCYAALSFLSNGLSTTVQKAHQTAFPGLFRAEFMLFAILPAALVYFILFMTAERKKQGKFSPESLILPASAGILNGLYMFMLVLLAASAIKAVVLYPLLAAGGILAACVSAFVFFKERFTAVQYAGIAVGIASVVLLNLR